MKNKAREFPARIEIELASACNLTCVYCPRKYTGKMSGFMNFSLLKKLIDEISLHPETILVLHRRGESLLHPDFIEICNYVKGKFQEVQIATNATLLDEDKSKALIGAVTFVSFSIDAPDTFNETRVPAVYKDVEAKILRFLTLNNGRIHTQVSMVRTLETAQENVELFKKIWSGKVERVRIYEEHSRNGKFGSLNRVRSQRQPCVMPFYEMLIYCDGKVGRCNHDWKGEPIGDINKTTIKEIWNSGVYKEFRRQHAEMDLKDEVCKNCDSWYPEIGNQGTGEIVKNA